MPSRAAQAKWLLLSSIVALAGCQSTAGPNWFNPPPPSYQRYEAQRFDPYPQTDMAPEMVGVRGREYDRQVAEPSRARWDPRTWVRRFSYGPK